MSHACKILKASAENINLCVDLLRDEAVVGVPTETVYGLAGNALNDVSLRKIFEAKGRPLLDPLIVHFSSIEQAEIHAEFNEHARALATQFWPGALTLVLPKSTTDSASGFPCGFGVGWISPPLLSAIADARRSGSRFFFGNLPNASPC